MEGGGAEGQEGRRVVSVAAEPFMCLIVCLIACLAMVVVVIVVVVVVVVVPPSTEYSMRCGTSRIASSF